LIYGRRFMVVASGIGSRASHGRIRKVQAARVK
jgi:hypothetical protein